MKKYTNDELEEHYRQAESCDSHIFAEMRSNILLVSGDHYRKTGELFKDRFKDVRAPQEMKLRLVKNHVQAIVKIYINSITSYAPSVRVLPFNQNELQDIKAADLNQAAWVDIKHRHKFRQKTREYVEDFVEFGEVCGKVIWDPMKGQFLGYEQAVDEEGYPLYTGPDGQPTRDPISYIQDPIPQELQNEPLSSGKPVFEGDLCIESVAPFNLLRDPNAESIDASPWLIIRKMRQINDVKKMVETIPDPEERERKLSYIHESGETTYKVFDGNKGEYVDGKGQVMLKEHYIRPCPDYPQGYFYIRTQAGVLFEGDLPFGIFPIVHETMDKIQTSARGRSIIKHLRPYQAEINRCASEIATTQITLGADKIITQYGSKITKGISHPGLRHYQVSGNPPTVIPGRSGEQYFQYLQAQIDEMYQAALLTDMMAEKSSVQDPMAMLYQSLRQKKVFSLYSDKIESFLCELSELCLKTARCYYPDSKIIRAVGRSEAVNIAEFKNTSPNNYQIKVESVAEDIDSLMGKQINLQTVLQYLGKDLPDDVKGKLIRQLPFLNEEESFTDLTLNEDNVTADILALDRGEWVEPDPSDDHAFYIRRLRHRMKKNDFKFLDPQIQQMYQRNLDIHKALEAEQLKKIQEAQAGFIPSSGPMAKVDLYVPKANGKGTERAVMPTESLMWLKKRLDEQGLSQQVLQQFAQEDVVDVAAQLQGASTLPAQNLASPPGAGMPQMAPGF